MATTEDRRSGSRTTGDELVNFLRTLLRKKFTQNAVVGLFRLRGDRVRTRAWTS